MDEKSFYDEKIIGIRNKFEQHEKDLQLWENTVPNDIHNGYIKIEGNTINFKERVIDGRLTILMPEKFELMDPLYIELKYPAYKNPNKIIYTNEATTINLMFDFREREMSAEETENARDQLSQVLLKVHPSSEIIEKASYKNEQGLIASFDLITPALDKDIYNFMFFFELKGTLAIGTFNCFKTEMHHWVDIVKQMVQSIKKL